MSLTPNPLGSVTPGRFELGDGGEILPSIGSTGVLATYTISPPGTFGVLASYSIQQVGSCSLLAYYAITPAVLAFAVNDVVVPAPERIQYGLLNQVGSDLSGVPVLQGWSSMTWFWTLMTDAEIAQLMPLYDPSGPRITVTYPNELGAWVRKACFLQPIGLGQRHDVAHSNVSLTFTHLSSD